MKQTKTLAQIQKELEEAKMLGKEAYKARILSYREDTRKSVQQCLDRCMKKIEQEDAEIDRIRQMQVFEQKLAGNALFCGIDEAGRGPLAGPVVAAAVIMPKDISIPYINDSKKLSEKKREELYEEIKKHAVAIGVGIVSEQVIDEINILQATYQAMRDAVEQLDPKPECLINDAVTIPGISMPQHPVIKGDAKCYSIAAASIIAKVTRDRIMKEYEKQYPGYGFAENKGYGSAKHIEAMNQMGLTPIHRRSFVKNLIQ